MRPFSYAVATYRSVHDQETIVTGMTLPLVVAAADEVVGWLFESLLLNETTHHLHYPANSGTLRFIRVIVIVENDRSPRLLFVAPDASCPILASRDERIRQMRIAYGFHNVLRRHAARKSSRSVRTYGMPIEFTDLQRRVGMKGVHSNDRVTATSSQKVTT